MASILETLSFVEFFLPLFGFLFILVLMYAILDKFKLMGDNKWVKWIASFSIALVFLFTQGALEFVNFITPWFVVLVVVSLFILSLFLFLGVKEGELSSAIKTPTVYWTIIILVLVLLFSAVAFVFGDFFSPYKDQPDKQVTTEGLKTFTHPRVLGALFLLVVSAFMVRFIAQWSESGK